MKFSNLSLVLTLVTASFASTHCFADTKKDMNAIMDLAGGMVSNGSVSKVTRYDVAKYDEYEEQRTAIVDFLNQGGCPDGGIKPRANMENNIKLMKRISEDGTGEPGEAEKMMKIVRKLKAQNQFKAILSVSWDEKEEAGESAEGVSCSVYLMRLFTVDGNKLTIVYSHTD